MSKLQVALDKRDEMAETYRENLPARYASVIGFVSSMLVIIPSGGIGALFALSAAGNLVSLISLIVTEGKELGASPRISPLRSVDETDYCANALKGEVKHLLEIVSTFGEEECLDLEYRNPSEFESLLADWRSYENERFQASINQSLPASAVAEFKFSSIERMRIFYFGSAIIDPDRECPAIPQPIYSRPTGGTPAPSNSRSRGNGQTININPPASSGRGNLSQQRDFSAPEEEDYEPVDCSSTLAVGSQRRFVEPNYYESAVEADLPPVEDLARVIAESNRNVMIVAQSQAGKTTLLVESIRHFSRLGYMVTLFDGKADPRLTENTTYVSINMASLVSDFQRRIAGFGTMLETRMNQVKGGYAASNFTPVLVVFEEYNVIRALLRRNTEALAELDSFVYSLICQGLAYRMRMIITTHSSRLAALGIDGCIADNLSFVSLGRDQAYESIEDCLKYQIDSTNTRDRLRAKLTNIEGTEIQETLALTTLGKTRIVRLPIVEKSFPMAAQNPPSTLESLEQAYDNSPDELDNEQNIELLDEESLSILNFARKNSETITARLVQQKIVKFKTTDSEIVRDIFVELAEAGFGVTVGEGKRLGFQAH